MWFDQTVAVENILSIVERGCIFNGRLDDGSKVRVRYVGNALPPIPGDVYYVVGHMKVFTDKRGRKVEQVETRAMKRARPKGDLLGPWLARLPNIGPVRSARLVEAFGHDLPVVLRNVHRIPDVAAAIEPSKPALAGRIAAQIYASTAEKEVGDRMKIEEIEFIAFLEKIGLRDARIAGQLWKFMQGDDAVGRLRRNPYLPAHLMSWKAADQIGQRLLCYDQESGLRNHPERLQGAIASVWREVLAEGDSAIPESHMQSLLASRDVDTNAALDLMTTKGRIRRCGNLLRVPGAAWIEDQVTTYLVRIEQSQAKIAVPNGKELAWMINEAEYHTGLTLTDEQRHAIGVLLHRHVAVLQGGAGVGKTTVMKILSLLWEHCGGNVVMGALAGKAALQLSRGSSTPTRPRIAYTLARLIGILEKQALREDESGQAHDFKFDDRTLLIIDEAGMMDTTTLHRLLRFLPSGARLLLAGDDGQLFPIGFGKVFHDLVAEGSRVARLTRVLRQAEDSAIPRVAAEIREGRTPSLAEWSGEKFGVFRLPAERRIAVQRDLTSEGELLVIAALRATVDSINETESHARREDDTPIRRLGPLATVAVGDPVVMTVNRYQHALLNGLLGVVTSLDGGISICFDGERTPRMLPEEAESDVELAYAITCHKAQGSSADAVIVLVEDTSIVTREWLYTSITRGKHLVLLVENRRDYIDQVVERRTTRCTGIAFKRVERSHATVE